MVTKTIDGTPEFEADDEFKLERDQENQDYLIKMGFLKGEAKAITESIRFLENAGQKYEQGVAKIFANVKNLEDLYATKDKIYLGIMTLLGRKEETREMLNQKAARITINMMVSHAEAVIKDENQKHKSLDDRVTEVTESTIETRRTYEKLIRRIKEDIHFYERTDAYIEKLKQEYNAALDANDNSLMDKTYECIEKLEDEKDKLIEDRDSMAEKACFERHRKKTHEQRKGVLKYQRSIVNLRASRLETQLSRFKDSEELIEYCTSMDGVISANEYINRLFEVNTNSDLVELRKIIMSNQPQSVGSENIEDEIEKADNDLVPPKDTGSELYKKELEIYEKERKQKL